MAFYCQRQITRRIGTLLQSEFAILDIFSHFPSVLEQQQTFWTGWLTSCDSTRSGVDLVHLLFFLFKYNWRGLKSLRHKYLSFSLQLRRRWPEIFTIDFCWYHVSEIHDHNEKVAEQAGDKIWIYNSPLWTTTLSQFHFRPSPIKNCSGLREFRKTQLWQNFGPATIPQNEKDRDVPGITMFSRLNIRTAAAPK